MRALAYALIALLPAVATAAETPAADAPAPSPAPTLAPAAPAGPEDDREKRELLQGRLDALEEQYSETKGDVLSLKRLKISGYVQARYVWAQNSQGGIDAKGNNLVKDGFSVRRGRVKFLYELPLSQLVLQIDASSAGGVVLKDGYVRLVEPFTGKGLALWVGQYATPFGYDAPTSSSLREMPERSRVSRAFILNERDRGAKLEVRIGVFNFEGGVFDGNGIANGKFPGGDNDQEKDGIGRVGFDLGWLVGGVSGWYGKTLAPGDYSKDDFVPRKTYPRTRVGADVQAYLDLLPIGGTTLKAEFIRGTTYWLSNVEQFGVPAAGFWVQVLQNFGLRNAVALRYDRFDHALGLPDAADPTDATRTAPLNSVATVGAAFIHYWDESVRLTAAFEVPMTGTVDAATDPKDDLFTLQVQAKF